MSGMIRKAVDPGVINTVKIKEGYGIKIIKLVRLKKKQIVNRKDGFGI